jgi:UDP:flavonoid glycosyltransferase YjiC (YdhE family)
MRVLFASWSGGGHFAPLVPLGWALRAAGHEVLVACHPGGEAQIVQSSLGALPVGPELDMFRFMRDVREGTHTGRPSKGYQGMLDIGKGVAGVLADDLLAYCARWQPDLVVYEPASTIGPLVAKVLGVPAVRQLWTCDFTAPVVGYPATVTGELPERYGIESFETAGDLTLDPCPPRIQVVDDLRRQPVRYVPYNGRSVEAPWLRAKPERRRVVITWGASLSGIDPKRMRHVPLIVEGLADLDAEIVVAVLDSQAQAFTTVPDNVRSIGPVPLHLVLPHCDLLLHQGGGGTMMTAVANGVPQVIVPSLVDTRFNAGFLAAAGVAEHVTGGSDVRVEDVVAAVQRVLGDPSYQSAADALLAEHLARPTPAEVVPVLESLVRDFQAVGASA